MDVLGKENGAVHPFIITKKLTFLEMTFKLVGGGDPMKNIDVKDMFISKIQYKKLF